MFLSQAAIDALFAVDVGYESPSRRPGESALSAGRHPTRAESFRAVPENAGDARRTVTPAVEHAPHANGQ